MWFRRKYGDQNRGHIPSSTVATRTRELFGLLVVSSSGKAYKDMQEDIRREESVQRDGEGN
jgi:hypothetical protein